MAIKNPTTLKGHEEFTALPEFEKEEDETARRTIELKGREFTIVSLDPFGFWEIRSTNGRLADELKNQKFTSPIEAELAITKYLASKG